MEKCKINAMGKTNIHCKTITINGVELDVRYSLYVEEMMEISAPYSEVELMSVKYNSRDVTDLIIALDVEEEIIQRL